MKIKSLLTGGIILAGFCAFFSCHEKPDEFCEYGFSKGLVVYTGAPEADGCGWTIEIGSVAYHPLNLDVLYQISDLPVLLKFKAEGEDFHCGFRIGFDYQSIRITEIRYHGDDLRTLSEDQRDQYKLDSFRMDSAYLDEDWLLMKVSYGGGCREHEFNLWKLTADPLNPERIEIGLSHESNADPCYGYITRWLVYSLVPLREKGKHEVTFMLRGSPEMSAYFGTYTYKY